LTLPHLLVAAAAAGSASLLLPALALGGGPGAPWGLRLVLLGSLITLAVVLEAEILTPHATLDAERAARFLTRGPLAAPLWAGVAGAGIALPIALLCTPWHAAWGRPPCSPSPGCGSTRTSGYGRANPSHSAEADPMTDRVTEPLHPVARDLQAPAEGLHRYPPAALWDSWEEFDPRAWPRRVKRQYSLIPTICFNCEAACGLLAYVDQRTLTIQKFEGNPAHPGSRGRNCAKGPATLNQVTDPERILYPLRRAGARGEGKWERVTWDEALDDIAGRIRKALIEKRPTEVMYHLGRPGHELVYLQRIFHAWGIDGHNSHTNVCSASARAGYAFWHGLDRPSPDHAKARVILLLSSHLEAGHYFNPHAQRITEGKQAGAKVCVVDTRLSNTASMADWWLSPWPGTEAALLLAMCHVLLREGTWDREFVRRWVNWEEYLREERPGTPVTFEAFERALAELYADYTPEFAERESGVPAARIAEIAREIGRANGALSTTCGGMPPRAISGAGKWRAPSSSWSSSPARWPRRRHRAVGLPQGGAGAAHDAAARQGVERAAHAARVPARLLRDELPAPAFPSGEPGKLAMYFTRVYNPVWTNPDGMSWIEMLNDEAKIERHACLTPIWSETAHFADYVLPMGHASERHDLMSQETHAARWIGFRQPVLRVALEKQGRRFDSTWQAHEAAGLGRSGKRTNSGSSCPGASIPTGPSASASISSRRTFPAPSSPSRSSTAGSSSTACPVSPPPPRKKA
jgi:anaerobic selenocysteine-containing dehydrogenase